jgi:hypothetical protein
MTRDIARHWTSVSADELPAQTSGSMQSRGDILCDLDARVQALNAVADTVYARWAQGFDEADRKAR